MAYQIEYAYTCHMGRVRANNEDNFWCCGELLPAENHGTQGIRSETISGNRTPALAVFDGMGGESCGEMAAFVASREHFRQVSTDHVLGRNLLGKAPLTQYLGVPEEQQILEPSIQEIEHKEGYRYLMCSDGVTDMLSDGEIADILARKIPLADIVELLLERALQKGGRDNVTIVLCEVQKQDSGRRLKTWLKGLKDKNER